MPYTTTMEIPAPPSPAAPVGLTPATPIQFARGVGPARAKALRELGINTLADLLQHYPRQYLDHQGQQQIADIKPGDLVTLRGTVIQTRLVRKRPVRFEALLDDSTGRCQLTWFNAFGLADRISPGVTLQATGKVTQFGSRPQITQPRYEVLSDTDTPASPSARPEPVYPANAELTTHQLAKIIREHLDMLLPHVEEWLPATHLTERAFFTRREAVEKIHRPATQADVIKARRTLAYHEFFLHQTAIAIKRYHNRNAMPAQPLRVDEAVDRRIRGLLDFELTPAQNHVIAQITKDLQQLKPMNRLLQGDVGSGKTVVALYAMLAAVASGGQAVLMAPTEILAEQHYITLLRYLSKSKVNIALLVGGLKREERAATLAGMEDGSVGLVVGTHAVLSQDVKFKSLNLVVIDEQHKFGVEQRSTIRSRHGAPHTLVMTATPIPRTLAMTAFGDLDVSVIDQLPPGRHPVFTKQTVSTNRELVYTWVAEHLKKGEQAYIVAPMIDDESFSVTPRLAQANDREPATPEPSLSQFTLKSVTGLQQELQQTWLRDHHVGLLHGRMDRETRQHVMERFRQGLIHALVATTVIEVGVDVPNATVMVIEHADRFGLSQLHQLRGRVGRSAKKSSCVLISDNTTDDGISRVQAMVRHASGFKIAEVDLHIRGMGQIIGTAQSGSSDMHFPDLLTDTALLSLARKDAFQTIAADPRLLDPAHVPLRKEILHHFGQSITLADVG